ncbi:MAG TPA: MGMT family protein [Hyphomicrobiaceae bacterium]|nr:MGMT family protein [Hyphomicrobiaceae bacterium]
MTPDQLKRELCAVVARVPVGRVLVIGALGRHFRVSPRAIETHLKGLEPEAREKLPWHRIVMDGGALGQIGPRSEHMARLRSEGLAVAPAGIVQDMERVAIRDVESLPATVAEVAPAEPVTAPQAAGPNRSRGRLGAPKSSV